MLINLRFKLLALVTIVLLSANTTPAYSEQQWWEGKTRKDFLNELLKSIEAQPAYQYKMAIESFEDGHKESNQIVWYKQPGHMRILQLGPYKKGATVVVEPDGKIVARLGGMFSVLPVTVAPDSSLIRGITGDYAPNSSYQAVINRALAREPLVTEFSIAQVAGTKNVVLYTRLNEPLNIHRMTVDAEKRLIIGLDRFKGENLSSRIIWSDIRFGKDIEEER